MDAMTRNKKRLLPVLAASGIPPAPLPCFTHHSINLLRVSITFLFIQRINCNSFILAIKCTHGLTVDILTTNTTHYGATLYSDV